MLGAADRADVEAHIVHNHGSGHSVKSRGPECSGQAAPCQAQGRREHGRQPCPGTDRTACHCSMQPLIWIRVQKHLVRGHTALSSGSVVGAGAWLVDICLVQPLDVATVTHLQQWSFAVARCLSGMHAQAGPLPRSGSICEAQVDARTYGDVDCAALVDVIVVHGVCPLQQNMTVSSKPQWDVS